MNLTPYLLLSSERINAETGHRCRRASSRPTKPPLNGYCGYAVAEILIPTYYVASNMGRQHTTWISDETWDRLKNIPGDSVSKKIANAIKFADPEEQMRQNELIRQYNQAKRYLRAIAQKHINGSGAGTVELLEECDWIWNADYEYAGSAKELKE